MSAELLYALDELEKDKGIDREVIIAAIEEALNASYGKSETEGNTRVEFNRETGDIKVYAQKEVVEKMENDTTELSLEEARKIDPEFEIGDIAEFEITPKNFGRLAAQKAKQIIIQKLREEERTRVYDQFRAKEKDVVTGTIQRIEMRENRDGKRSESFTSISARSREFFSQQNRWRRSSIRFTTESRHTCWRSGIKAIKARSRAL